MHTEVGPNSKELVSWVFVAVPPSGAAEYDKTHLSVDTWSKVDKVFVLVVDGAHRSASKANKRRERGGEALGVHGVRAVWPTFFFGAMWASKRRHAQPHPCVTCDLSIEIEIHRN